MLPAREEQRLRERAAHADHVFGGARQHECPGHALAAARRRRQQHLLPGGIEVAVVPGGRIPRPSRCVAGWVVTSATQPLAHDPDLAAVAQGFAVFGAGAHPSRSGLRRGGRRHIGAARRQRGGGDGADIDLRHRDVDRAQAPRWRARCSSGTPRRNRPRQAGHAAAGVQFERRIRGRRAPRTTWSAASCNKRRALLGGIAAAAERIPPAPPRSAGSARSLSDGGDDQRRAGHDAQDLGDALARLAGSPGRRASDACSWRSQYPGRGEGGVAFGGGRGSCARSAPRPPDRRGIRRSARVP